MVWIFTSCNIIFDYIKDYYLALLQLILHFFVTISILHPERLPPYEHHPMGYQTF